jgi:hypothetical protein
MPVPYCRCHHLTSVHASARICRLGPFFWWRNERQLPKHTSEAAWAALDVRPTKDPTLNRLRRISPTVAAIINLKETQVSAQ